MIKTIKKRQYIFAELIKIPKHKYPKEFSKNSYNTKSLSLINMKYCISVQEPKLRNNFLQNEKKLYIVVEKNCKFKVYWKIKWSDFW